MIHMLCMLKSLIGTDMTFTIMDLFIFFWTMEEACMSRPSRDFQPSLLILPQHQTASYVYG